MGVKNFNSQLKQLKFCPPDLEPVQTSQVLLVDNISVVYVDVFGCFYNTMRKFLVHESYEKFSRWLLNLFKPFQSSLKIIFVLDGKGSVQKSGTHQRRLATSNKCLEKLTNAVKSCRKKLDTEEYISKELHRRVKKAYFNSATIDYEMKLSLLEALNSVVQSTNGQFETVLAEGEADLFIAKIQGENVAVISQDSDFAFRRNITYWFKPRVWCNQLKLSYINVPRLAKAAGMKQDAWTCLAIVSGNDYADNLKSFGIGRNYKFLKDASSKKTIACKNLLQLYCESHVKKDQKVQTLMTHFNGAYDSFVDCIETIANSEASRTLFNAQRKEQLAKYEAICEAAPAKKDYIKAKKVKELAAPQSQAKKFLNPLVFYHKNMFKCLEVKDPVIHDWYEPPEIEEPPKKSTRQRTKKEYSEISQDNEDKSDNQETKKRRRTRTSDPSSKKARAADKKSIIQQKTITDALQVCTHLNVLKKCHGIVVRQTGMLKTFFKTEDVQKISEFCRLQDLLFKIAQLLLRIFIETQLQKIKLPSKSMSMEELEDWMQQEPLSRIATLSDGKESGKTTGAVEFYSMLVHLIYCKIFNQNYTRTGTGIQSQLMDYFEYMLQHFNINVKWKHVQTLRGFKMREMFSEVASRLDTVMGQLYYQHLTEMSSTLVQFDPEAARVCEFAESLCKKQAKGENDKKPAEFKPKYSEAKRFILLNMLLPIELKKAVAPNSDPWPGSWNITEYMLVRLLGTQTTFEDGPTKKKFKGTIILTIEFRMNLKNGLLIRCVFNVNGSNLSRATPLGSVLRQIIQSSTKKTKREMAFDLPVESLMKADAAKQKLDTHSQTPGKLPLVITTSFSTDGKVLDINFVDKSKRAKKTLSESKTTYFKSFYSIPDISQIDPGQFKGNIKMATADEGDVAKLAWCLTDFDINENGQQSVHSIQQMIIKNCTLRQSSANFNCELLENKHIFNKKREEIPNRDCSNPNQMTLPELEFELADLKRELLSAISHETEAISTNEDSSLTTKAQTTPDTTIEPLKAVQENAISEDTALGPILGQSETVVIEDACASTSENVEMELPELIQNDKSSTSASCNVKPKDESTQQQYRAAPFPMTPIQYPMHYDGQIISTQTVNGIWMPNQAVIPMAQNMQQIIRPTVDLNQTQEIMDYYRSLSVMPPATTNYAQRKSKLVTDFLSSNSIEKVSKTINRYVQVFHELQCFYGRQRILTLKSFKKRGQKSMLDLSFNQFINMLGVDIKEYHKRGRKVSNPEQYLIVFGDGGGFKGSYGTAVQYYIEKLRQSGITNIFKCKEHYISQKCPRCLHQETHRVKECTREHKGKSYSLFLHRDGMAAHNMSNLVRSQLQVGKRPDYLPIEKVSNKRLTNAVYDKAVR